MGFFGEVETRRIRNAYHGTLYLSAEPIPRARIPSMKPSRFLSLIVAATMLIGCDDPSNLGVDLVDTSTGTPEVVRISTSGVTTARTRDITGNARRSLIGRVVDPVAGTLAASAGLDFASPVTLSDNFKAGPVTDAELRLVRTYRYGDTTSTLDINLRSIDVEWIASGSDSKTEIPFGALITTTSLSPQDSLVRVPLPPAWIEANDALLRSANFITDFQGFYVEAAGGNVIVGFSSQTSSMRVVSGADTVDFVVSRNLTRVVRSSPAVPPPGLSLMQDGVGEGLEVAFDYEESAARGAVLSRAVLRVALDSVSAPPPVHFVRPRPSQVDLAGVTTDSLVFTLAVSTQQGDFLIFDSTILRGALQDLLLGRSVFERFVITGHADIAPVANTVDVLLLENGTSGTRLPEINLTVIRP